MLLGRRDPGIGSLLLFLVLAGLGDFRRDDNLLTLLLFLFLIGDTVRY